MSRPRLVLLLLVTAVANLGLDRLTKALAVAYLRGADTASYLGGVVLLGYAENTGAFLGLGQTWPDAVKLAVFVVVPIAVCLLVLAYAFARETSALRAVLLVTVAAGGLGNLFDRLTQNFHVVDFLNFGLGPLRTGVLNVADLSVTLGLVALLFTPSLSRRPS